MTEQGARNKVPPSSTKASKNRSTPFRLARKRMRTTVDYFMEQMMISDDPRSVIGKDFRYTGGFSGPHFREHVKCVARGIRYRWLVYDSIPTERSAKWGWTSYQRAVRTGLKELHADGEFRESRRSDPFDEQIQVRILNGVPIDRQIPWRVTILGGGAANAEPEPFIGSYGDDPLTITFDHSAAADLKAHFDRLWEVARSQNQESSDGEQTDGVDGTVSQNPMQIMDSHSEFKRHYLHHFVAAYRQDVPVYRIEESTKTNERILIATLTVVVLTLTLLLYQLHLL